MAGAHPHLGLWGWYNAGKTSFLVALYNMTVDRLMAERYAWWRMYPTNEAGERFVETTARRFLPSGIFPRHTPEGSIYTYNFDIEWRESRLWRRSFSLTAVDAAGAYTGDPLIDPMIDPMKGGYFTALRECRGLVCLIETQCDNSGRMVRPVGYDGIDLPETYYELFDRLFRKINASRSDNERPFIALCLTKVDMDNCWKSYGEAGYDNEKFGRAIIGEEAYKLVRNHCEDRFRFFATSAVGRYQPLEAEPDLLVTRGIRKANGQLIRPNIEPAGDTFKLADCKQWDPLNVWTPLHWLIDRIETDKRRSPETVRWRGLRRLRRAD